MAGASPQRTFGCRPPAMAPVVEKPVGWKQRGLAPQVPVPDLKPEAFMAPGMPRPARRGQAFADGRSQSPADIRLPAAGNGARRREAGGLEAAGTGSAGACPRLEARGIHGAGDA